MEITSWTLSWRGVAPTSIEALAMSQRTPRGRRLRRRTAAATTTTLQRAHLQGSFVVSDASFGKYVLDVPAWLARSHLRVAPRIINHPNFSRPPPIDCIYTPRDRAVFTPGGRLIQGGAVSHGMPDGWQTYNLT